MTDLYVRGFLDLCVEMVKRSNRTPEAPPFYFGPMDLVRREGESFAPAEYDAERWRFEGTPTNCYGDALDLALRWPELTYVEGYASRMIPGVHHAWCVTDDGTVVDATWAACSGDAVGEEYLGVRFPNDFVVDVLAKKGTYGVLDYPPLWDEPLATTVAGFATFVAGEAATTEGEASDDNA